MKKRILAVVLAALMAITAVCLVSCEDKSDAKPIKDGVKPDPRVLEYAETIDETYGADTDILKIDVTARGNSVVYMYTYKEKNSSTKKEREALEKTIKEIDGSQLVKLSKYDCSAVESIIYEYYESDGDLMVSVELK